MKGGVTSQCLPCRSCCRCLNGYMVRSAAPLPAVRAYFSDLGRMRMLAGDPALDFANTLHWRGGSQVDFIPSYSALVEWSLPAGLLTEEEVGLLQGQAPDNPDDTASAHRAALYLRRIWRDRLEHRMSSPRMDETMQALRTLLAEMLGDGGLHSEKVPGGNSDPGSRFMLPIRRVTLAIASLELIPIERRIGRCEGDPCGGFFLDSSRSKPRRWCSMDTCGNKAKVRKYRGRIRAEEVTGD